ncbi:hypothetical protein ACFXTO_032660 [Malus domestica]
MKMIKADTLARPIAVVEPAANEGGKNKSSPPTQEMSVEKKPKTSSAAREGLLVADKFVIDLTSSKGKKYEKFHRAPNAEIYAKTFVGAKSSSPLEKHANMKSDKVDSAARVAPKPTPLAIEIDSPTEKEETAHVGSYEKSTMLVSGEAAEIYALLKPYMLEYMDACAKLIDGVKWVVCLSSFAKHTMEYRRTALFAMIQKKKSDSSSRVYAH